MTLPIRLLAFLSCLLLPVTCPAMEPLPVADLARGSSAVCTSLRALLDDYAVRLPTQHGLRLLVQDTAPAPSDWSNGSIPGSGGGFPKEVSWSPHQDALAKACGEDPSGCAAALQAQFDLLAAEWRTRDAGKGVSLRDAVLISALSGICGAAGFSDLEGRCDSRQDLAAIAGAAWLDLGYHHLFLAFQDIGHAERDQMRAWLESEAKLPPEELKRAFQRLERDRGAQERDASAFELRSSPSEAYALWVEMLLRHSLNSNEKGMLKALASLARLAAQQGNREAAEKWWQLGQALLAEHPGIGEPGQRLLDHQRFSIDLVPADDKPALERALTRLQSLIDRQLSFTGPAVEYALRALRAGEPSLALAGLKRARAACAGSDLCGYTRIQQMEALIGVSEGDSAALRAGALYWQGRIETGALLDAEIRIVWALAERLRQLGALKEAAALYRALDGELEPSRGNTALGSPADLAPFDELKRMRVRLDVEAGTLVPVLESESLRGRELLQRLRSERWLKELAGEDDAGIRGELERRSSELQAIRKQLKELAPGSQPVLRAALRATLLELEGAERLHRHQYLNQLAAKRLKADWLTKPWALTRHQFSGQLPSEPLDLDDAYLSWLQVPGGYVGTLVAADPRDPANGTPRTRVQRFIPFASRDEALLQLYRDLLQSGRTASRGVVRTAPVEKDGKGLLLNGQPIWHQADGSFGTGPSAPAGSRRVRDFSDLSDALFERLLAPFAGAYQDARRLIISPDGALTYLPFETLTRRGVPVPETVDIGYVQSLALYEELKKRNAAKNRGREPRLLTVADPRYDSVSQGAGAAAALPPDPLESLAWSPLPGTRQESAALSALFRDNRQLLGAEASISGLRGLQERRALKEFQILHFATHGYVDDEQSALVLTPGSEPLSAYLRDRDIVAWDLDSDLVLLSACNTGIGRQQTGEGIVGLPYAFFMAGNINTLMSLWPVDDAGTAALIPEFMKRVSQGQDQVGALNDTKRAFARGEFGEALSNPRVWSAFVLYGVPMAAGSGTGRPDPP